jgi:hypothetical protein
LTRRLVWNRVVRVSNRHGVVGDLWIAGPGNLSFAGLELEGFDRMSRTRS